MKRKESGGSNDEHNQCATCGRKGEADCSRVDCSNRRTITTQVPDGCDSSVYGDGTSWRRSRALED